MGQLDALLRSVYPADERPAARQSLIQDHAAIVPYLFARLLLGDPLHSEEARKMQNQDLAEHPLTPDLLHKIDAYFRAASYLSVGQIYL